VVLVAARAVTVRRAAEEGRASASDGPRAETWKGDSRIGVGDHHRMIGTYIECHKDLQLCMVATRVHRSATFTWKEAASDRRCTRTTPPRRPTGAKLIAAICNVYNALFSDTDLNGKDAIYNP
jgi:hypothetical protein